MKKFAGWMSAMVLGCAVGLAGNWVTYEGQNGPGRGKHIVFLTGDEEYRSEEGLPMLARVLAVRHGFKCTVLFSVDGETGMIAPNNVASIEGIEALAGADLCVMLLRFREWPDAQMKQFVEYYRSGRPFLALRTSTHAFYYQKNKQSPYARFDWQSKDWPGGFGRQVLGETWVAHHGAHKVEATRGVIEASAARHPVLRGVTDIFGDTDVYTANPPQDVTVLVRGQVLTGMKPTDPPVTGKKNDPMQPLVWAREYRNEAGKTNRVVTTTMGAATDLQSEGLRRLLVNAAYWLTGLGDRIPAAADVAYVGEYKPSFYGSNGYRKGVKPADLALP
jgi:hypothetical protein